MNAIDALLSRNSAALLEAPAPPEQQLNQMFQAALRAADHGWLHPTRFITVAAGARGQLGRVFLESQENWQELPEEKQHKLLNAPLRAPMVIVVVHRQQPHPKIPDQEQLLSSAASAQNLLNAAWALGLGAIWRTGDVAFNPKVAAALGLQVSEQIIGFIYVGHPKGEPKKLPELQLLDFVSDWQG